jgi:hypothetical protein
MVLADAEEVELSEADRQLAEGLIAEAEADCVRIMQVLAASDIVPSQSVSMGLVLAAATVAKDARVKESAFIGMARACFLIAPGPPDAAEVAG